MIDYIENLLCFYFSDHNEEGMEGGSFKFHKLKNIKYQNDRFIDINNCEEIASLNLSITVVLFL